LDKRCRTSILALWLRCMERQMMSFESTARHTFGKGDGVPVTELGLQSRLWSCSSTTVYGVTRRQNQVSLSFLAQLGIGINGVAVLVLELCLRLYGKFLGSSSFIVLRETT
jgi:hypothetical protein